MKNIIYRLSLLCLLFGGFVGNCNGQDGLSDLILSTTSDDFSDLAFLDSIIQNKKVIFLGESHHGIEDFNKMKFRIIRYLHENHDFNLVIFEAGVHEAALTNIIKDSLSSLEMLTQSLMGYWRTESNCKMMKYLRDNQIDIAGMDFVSHALPPKKRFYRDIYDDPDLANRFFLLDSSFYYEYRMKRGDFYQNHKDALVLDKNLDSLAQYLIDNYTAAIDELKQAQSNNRELLLWANNAIVQEISETKKIDNGYYSPLSPYRDSTMALNIGFAIDSVYPNEKTIVWAHNGHISKKGDEFYLHSIGDYLKNSLMNQSLFIALGAIDGTFTVGYNPPYKIKLKRTNLERKYKNIQTKGIYVSAKNADLRKGMNSVGYLRSDSIQKLFDGFIFLKDVKASEFIKYNGPNNCE